MKKCWALWLPPAVLALIATLLLPAWFDSAGAAFWLVPLSFCS